MSMVWNTRIRFFVTSLSCVSVLGISQEAFANDTQRSNSQPRIVEGEIAPECGWPTTLNINGCTATLIHPKAVSTAVHCGNPTQACFGTKGDKHCVSIGQCVKPDDANDAMLCTLSEEITEIPPTPLLFGCELEKYRKVGQAVVIAGFGRTSNTGSDYGTLRWARQKITRVENDMTVVGDAAVMPSPCNGDSGGPLYVQVDDGSWRNMGTVFRGTTNTQCNSAANYQRPELIVDKFESATGIDITPCFDGKTGDWEPTAECMGFFAGDETGKGNWNNWCEGTPQSKPSAQCGDPWGDDPGDDDDDDTNEDDDSSDSDTSTQDDDDTSTDDDDATSSEDDDNTSDEDPSESTPDDDDDSNSETTPDGDDDTSDESSSDEDDDSGKTDGETDEESESTDEKSDNDSPNTMTDSSGCSCRSDASRSASWMTFLFALLGITSVRRRRHRA